jgi:hypothetical protein
MAHRRGSRATPAVLMLLFYWVFLSRIFPLSSNGMEGSRGGGFHLSDCAGVGVRRGFIQGCRAVPAAGSFCRDLGTNLME